jgi:trans-aconitate methyltransferase
MRLNLGANDRAVPGFLSVDIVPPADIIADLSQPWPWPDSSVEEVLAYDVFEHLPDKRQTLNELWRVLKHGGIARIQVPDSSEGDGADCDLTHVSRWNRSCFEYVEIGTFERERFRASPYYGIKADFQVIEMTRTQHVRRRGSYVMEIQAVLRAVK